MTRFAYIDRLVRLTLDISAVMDLLPHAAPLGADEKIRAQGRMLALKTALDHAAGEQGDDPYAEEFRARQSRRSPASIQSRGTRSLTGAGTARCTRPGRPWSGI